MARKTYGNIRNTSGSALLVSAAPPAPADNLRLGWAFEDGQFLPFKAPCGPRNGAPGSIARGVSMLAATWTQGTGPYFLTDESHASPMPYNRFEG